MKEVLLLLLIASFEYILHDSSNNLLAQAENASGLKKPGQNKSREKNSTSLVDISVTIRDAVCYSAKTESPFTIYLLALDYNGQFLSAFSILAKNFYYDNRTYTRRYKKQLRYHSYTELTFHRCFQEGYIDCAPRADAVLIRYESTPDDPWAIDLIFVDVTFQLGETGTDLHIWHFEHSNIRPCESWLDRKGTYQFGPRTGLVISHKYEYFPEPFEIVRDWV